MKQLKEFLATNIELTGLSRISHHQTELSTLRNSFADCLYTDRSVINEQDTEKKRNKIKKQLNILETSIIHTSRPNTTRKKRTKQLNASVENIRPKKIKITSKELHEIRKFDQQLYQGYLKVYNEHQLQLQINQQNQETLKVLQQELDIEKKKETELNKQIQVIEAKKEQMQQQLNKTNSKLITSIRKKISSDLHCRY